MRVIARSKLREWQETYPEAAGQLEAWYAAVRRADWSSSFEVSKSGWRADPIGNNRVVFNIKGNDYRLLAAIFYPGRIVYLKWFGPHSEYDKIDAETVEDD